MPKIRKKSPHGLRKTVYPDNTLKTLVNLQEQLDSTLTKYTNTATIDINDDICICDSVGDFVLTLLPVVNMVKRTIIIKNINTGIITVKGNNSDTIDGVNTYSLDIKYESITLYCDGTQWLII